MLGFHSMGTLAQHRVVAGRKTQKAPGLLWAVLVLWKLERVAGVSNTLEHCCAYWLSGVAAVYFLRLLKLLFCFS